MRHQGVCTYEKKRFVLPVPKSYIISFYNCGRVNTGTHGISGYDEAYLKFLLLKKYISESRIREMDEKKISTVTYTSHSTGVLTPSV
jgi:hypothetical protein